MKQCKCILLSVVTLFIVASFSGCYNQKENALTKDLSKADVFTVVCGDSTDITAYLSNDDLDKEGISEKLTISKILSDCPCLKINEVYTDNKYTVIKGVYIADNMINESNVNLFYENNGATIILKNLTFKRIPPFSVKDNFVYVDNLNLSNKFPIKFNIKNKSVNINGVSKYIDAKITKDKMNLEISINNNDFLAGRINLTTKNGYSTDIIVSRRNIVILSENNLFTEDNKLLTSKILIETKDAKMHTFSSTDDLFSVKKEIRNNNVVLTLIQNSNAISNSTFIKESDNNDTLIGIHIVKINK